MALMPKYAVFFNSLCICLIPRLFRLGMSHQLCVLLISCMDILALHMMLEHLRVLQHTSILNGFLNLHGSTLHIHVQPE